MQKRQATVVISLFGLAVLQFILMAVPAPLGAQAAGGPPAQGTSPAPPPAQPVPAAPAARTCITGQCHATMGKNTSVHKPVQEGICTGCHEVAEDPLKATKHPDHLVITLVRKGADLCARCHEPKNRKGVVHAPLKNGECATCHDPHQSAHKGLLKEDERSLCFRCHKKQEEALKTGTVVHAPVKQSCVKCHDPHESAAACLLNAPVPDVCSSCHPKIAALGPRAFTKHGPMNDQKSCLNCHDPHVAAQPGLLLTSERALCLACHNREMVSATGKIKDLKAFLDANGGGKGPLKGKPCNTCHDPHGADYWRLLKKYYVSSFYIPYSDAQYSLCFSCHNREAFKVLKITKANATLTNFRDGSKNLHFVHVNKIDKGRTCRACHEVCAECQSSGLPKHVKKSVAFSGWNMPLNYTPTANGGSCAPGCHGEKLYQR